MLLELISAMVNQPFLYAISVLGSRRDSSAVMQDYYCSGRYVRWYHGQTALTGIVVECSAMMHIYVAMISTDDDRPDDG